MYKRIVSLIVCVFICFFSFNMDVLADEWSDNRLKIDDIDIDNSGKYDKQILCSYKVFLLGSSMSSDNKAFIKVSPTAKIDSERIDSAAFGYYFDKNNSRYAWNHGEYIVYDGGGAGYNIFYMHGINNSYKDFWNKFLEKYEKKGNNCPSLVFCTTSSSSKKWYAEFGSSAGSCDKYDGVRLQVAKPGDYNSGIANAEEAKTNPEVNEKKPVPSFIDKLFGGEFGDLSCSDLFGGVDDDGNEVANNDLINLLSSLVSIVKILVPIVLIVLGSLDIAQSVFSQDDGGIKKAQSKFIKRLIIAVVIFLIPSILGLLLSISHEIWPNVINDDFRNFCGILK